MKFKKIAVALCAAALSLTVMSVTAFAADAGVKIDAAHFPDANFREYVKEFDTDGSNSFSAEEILKVKEIFCTSCDISSLNGIEYFTALEHLSCGYNELTSLDVSKNTAITHLFCENNNMTSLDVDGCTELIDLECNDNQLTKLNVSMNTKLTELHCYRNNLSKIDVSKNTALTKLWCFENQLTSLDVSKNTALTTLSCYRNQLTELNVSTNAKLEELYCYSNKLKSLDISACTALTYLDCVINNLTSLDVSKNTALINLGCGDNQIKSLDVSKNTELTVFDCCENQLTKLDVSKNTKLYNLYCYSNKLTVLDVSKNTELKELLCYDNQLTELNIKNNPNLITAYKNGGIYDDVSFKSYIYADHENSNYFRLSIDNFVDIFTASKPHTTHTWDSGKVTKAATYGATGVKTYTCTICGAKKTSSIAKKTVKKLTAKTTYSCTTNAVRINWNKLSGVTGYKIFRYDDAKKKWVAVKAIYDPNTTNYKISGLKSGKVYKFRVKAFVKENGKFYFGESCSTISTATRPNTTTVTKANKTSTAVRLFWKKTTCSGYRILRYDSAKKKWVRVTAVGSSATTQYKISGLKKNTTYKFKVQPYVKVGSKVIDGAASAVFTVKTSK